MISNLYLEVVKTVTNPYVNDFMEPEFMVNYNLVIWRSIYSIRNHKAETLLHLRNI